MKQVYSLDAGHTAKSDLIDKMTERALYYKEKAGCINEEISYILAEEFPGVENTKITDVMYAITPDILGKELDEDGVRKLLEGLAREHSKSFCTAIRWLEFHPESECITRGQKEKRAEMLTDIAWAEDFLGKSICERLRRDPPSFIYGKNKKHERRNPI